MDMSGQLHTPGHFISRGYAVVLRDGRLDGP